MSSKSSIIWDKNQDGISFHAYTHGHDEDPRPVYLEIGRLLGIEVLTNATYQEVTARIPRPAWDALVTAILERYGKKR